MAKSKQDPTLELGPSSAEDENQGIFLPVPIADMILPPEKELQLKAEMVALSDKYRGFEIKSKQDYENLKADLKYIAERRILVDGKDGWRVVVKRMADTISGKLLAILEPAEAILKGIKKAYDDAEAERLRLAKEAADKLIADRKSDMFGLGAKYDGSAYVLGNVEIYPEDLPKDDYLLKIEKMRAEKERLDEVERVRKEKEEKERQEELERQRVAKEEAEKLAADNARIEAENKALRDQLAALNAAKVEPLVNVQKPIEEFAALLDAASVPNMEDMPATLNEPAGNPVVTAAPLMRPNPILDTTDRDAEKYGPVVVPPVTKSPDVPATVTASPAKFVPMEIDFANDADLVHAYQSGAYAFAKQARAKFPSITVSEWKSLWDEFLAGTK